MQSMLNMRILTHQSLLLALSALVFLMSSPTLDGATSGRPGPTAVGVTPSGLAGGSQTFNFSFAHPNSAAQITDVAMLWSDSPSHVSDACYVRYDATRNTLALYGD